MSKFSLLFVGVLLFLSAFFVQVGEGSSHPTITNTEIFAILGVPIYIGGENFGSQPLSSSYYIEFSHPSASTTIISSSDTSVETWSMNKIVVDPDFPIDSNTTIKIATPVGETNTVPLSVYQYTSFPLTGTNGLPLDLEYDKETDTLWSSAEFSHHLVRVAPGDTMATALSIPQPPDPNYIFSAPPVLGGGPTPISGLAEEVDIDSNGDIWTTQGGALLYSGPNVNASRIVRYTPSTGNFKCYNIPTDHAEIFHTYIDDNSGVVWASLGGRIDGNFVISFNPSMFTQGYQTSCSFDFQTEAPVGYCSETGGQEPCFERYEMLSNGSGPTGLEKTQDGSIWVAQFYNSSIAKIDVTTASTTSGVTEYSLLPYSYGFQPTPEWNLGSGPFDVDENPIDGHLYVTETFDTEIVEFDPITGQIVTQYTLSEYNDELVPGSDQLHSGKFDNVGNYWFSIYDVSKTPNSEFPDGVGWIGRITPQKEVQFFPPLTHLFPGGVSGMEIDNETNSIWSGEFYEKNIMKLTPVTELVQNVPPTAEAGKSFFNRLGRISNFNASGSHDSDGTIVEYRWNFGDGSPTVNGATASHTYAKKGTYIVTLMVTDDSGLIDFDTLTVTVTSSGGK